MVITYKNRKLEKICTDARSAEKSFGREMACKIHQRIGEISVADSVELLVRYHIGRCHLLSQNRKSEYAMDLVQPYRLIFEVNRNEIQIANILEIIDYH